MNQIYKVIFNPLVNERIVVSELAKGKAQSSSLRNKFLSTLAVLGFAFIGMSSASAAGIIVNGTTEHAPAGTIIDTGTTSGTAGYALYVINNGQFIADGDISLTTGGDNANAIALLGAGSSISLVNGSTLVTSGTISHGVYMRNTTQGTLVQAIIKTLNSSSNGINIGSGSMLTLDNSSLTTEGNSSQGIAANNSGTITIVNSNITTKGTYGANGAHALHIANGSTGSITGSTIQSYGNTSGGVFVETTNGAATSFVINDSIIETFGASSGVTASELNGIGSSTVTLNGNNQITTQNGIGVRARGVGSKAIINAGTAIYAKGIGVQATLNGAQLEINNSSIVTDKVNSAGMSVDTGSQIKATNVEVTTLQDNAFGLNAMTAGRIEATGVNVRTKGNLANGVDAQSGGQAVLNGGRITTEGNNAHGLYATDSGTHVTLNNTAISVSGMNAHGVISNKDAQVIINQKNNIFQSTHGSSLYAEGGYIDANLDGSLIQNNGILINSRVDISSGLNSTITLNAKNLSMSGDVQADIGSIANLNLENAIWNGQAVNGTNFDVDASSIWYMQASSDVANLSHAGRIYFPTPSANNFSTLTVHNDYVGNMGTILLNTQLGSDDSPSDRLVVEGNTTGHSKLHITNVGGTGALTRANGIEVVEVLGASSIGTFELTNDLLAGAYSYQLVQTGNNWYLTSYLPSVDSGTTSGGGLGLRETITVTYRPDAGVNLANRESVIEMMVPGLSGSGVGANNILGSGAIRSSIRLGNGTLLGQKSNSLWSFVTTNKSNGRAADSQISYNATSYTLQVGGDRTFAVGDGLIQAGIMAHMSTVNSKSLNRLTGGRATGGSDGYGFGLYATWFLRADDILSPFIDTYAIFGRYSNTVKTRNNAQSKYNSNAVSFTIHGGYPIALTSKIILEPQAQLSYVNYKNSHYQDHGGTNVDLKTKGNMIGRIGAYVYGHGYKIEPYGALNVWYDDTQAEMVYNINSGAVSANKRGAIFEAKIGFQTQATQNLTLWGEISGRKGQNNYHDFGAAVGVKYAW